MSGKITRILQCSTDPSVVAAQVMPIVYESLREIAARRMARERSVTISPTELVHETYFRLFGPSGASYENRRHFFAAAAEAMRRILIDRARARCRIRRGGPGDRGGRGDRGDAPLAATNATGFEIAVSATDAEFLALDRVLAQLEAIAPRPALIVKLRYFLGLTIEDTARILDLGTTTVKADWFFARAWLRRMLVEGHPEHDPARLR